MMDDRYLVRLTERELRDGAACGAAQRCNSLMINGSKPNMGERTDPKLWTTNIEGTLGEIAAAKFLGLKWVCDLTKFQRVGDLPTGLEVKTSDLESRYHTPALNVNERALVETRPYVLMVGRCMDFRIAGWMMGKRVGVPSHWKGGHDEGQNFWQVPLNELWPVEELQEWVRVELEQAGR